MPRSTFERLTKEKKERLLQAALKEFSRVPYHEASINRIIEEATISRGSFYQYFKDKEDLYQHLLQSYKQKLKELIDYNIILYQGDLYLTFLHLFQDMMDYLEQSPYVDFFKNVFQNLTITTEKFIIPHHKENCPPKEIQNLKNQIDAKQLRLEGWNIDEIFELLMQITIPSIMYYMLSDIGKKEAYQKYKQKLNMICKGIYREEYQYDKNV